MGLPRRRGLLRTHRPQPAPRPGRTRRRRKDRRMNPKPVGVPSAVPLTPAAGVSESLLRLVFDCAPVGIAVLELGEGRLGRVLAANQELCKLLGYDYEDTVGQSLEVLLDGIGASATTSIQ